MNGWLPADSKAETGARLAVWQGPYSALNWLRALVGTGDVIDTILAGPPEAREVWTRGAHDIIGPGWHGKTVIYQEVVSDCRLDEWLVIQAWDES